MCIPQRCLWAEDIDWPNQTIAYARKKTGGMVRVRKFDSREQGLEYILKCLNVTNPGANLCEVTKFSHSADELNLPNFVTRHPYIPQGLDIERAMD